MVRDPRKTPPPARKTVLQERDLDILQHVCRYKMTVARALQRQPFFAEAGPHALGNVIRRLREGGWLQSAWLYDGITSPAENSTLAPRYCYYHLTPAAAALLGEHPSIAQPLKDEPKIRAYAILAFCCFGDVQREKLTPQEYRDMFPELQRPGERTNYYIDTEGPRKRLGYIRVDYGGRGRWDRLISSCRDDVRKRCDKRAFREIILQGGFVITIITALEQKANRLQAALQEQQFPVDVRIHVVPELLELIAPGPRRTRQESRD